MDRITRGKALKNVFVDGRKIRLFAECFGVSIRELARQAGCSHTYLIRVLDGKRHISTRYIAKIVEVLEGIARTYRLDSATFFQPVLPSLPQGRPAPSLEDVA